MRWLPDRKRPQHWASRLFQIGQATLLSGMFLIITIGEPAVVADRVGWFWFTFAMIAWVSLLTRCGWAVNLMITAIVVAALLTPAIDGGPSGWELLEGLLFFGLMGFVAGAILDAIGLATRAAVEYSNASSCLTKSPSDSDEPTEPTPPIEGVSS